MLIHEFHVFELRIETNVYDPRRSLRCLSNSEKDLKNSFFRPEREVEPCILCINIIHMTTIGNFAVPKIARSPPVLGCKPSGVDGGSYSWAPETVNSILKRG